MAIIRQYESNAEAPRPSDRGVEAATQAGRRIGAFYHQEGQDIGGGIQSLGQDVDRITTHEQISHGGVAFAGTFYDLAQKSRDLLTSSDPNDPTVVPKFMAETVEPALAKLQDGFLTDGGSKWAQGQAEQVRNHFYTTMSADQVTMRGNAAVANKEAEANTYAVNASKDPQSVYTAIPMIKASVDGFAQHSGLAPDEAARMTGPIKQQMLEHVTDSAIRSAIEMNPAAGLKMAEDPTLAPYIKNKDDYTAYANAQQNIKNSQAAHAATMQDREDRKNVNAFMADSVQKYVKVENGHVTVDPKFLDQMNVMSRSPEAQRGAVTPGDLTDLFKMQRQYEDANKREVTDDPMTKGLLQQAMLDGTDITQDLVKANVDGKMSMQTVKDSLEMQSALNKDPEAKPIIKDALAGARSTIISPLLPGQKDAKGEQLYADFKSEFAQKVLKLGHDDQLKASNFSDPNSVISTMLKDPKYNRSMTQRTQDLMTSMSGGGVEQGGAAGVAEAIHAQESGGAANARTSVTGATGGWQIQPTTFSQYAQAGERIDNPQDNEAVGRRIIADYQARWPNDPARVAVAYFSGPGNVAPVGSPTPYLRDSADPTGKTTSSYVADVVRRQQRAQ